MDEVELIINAFPVQKINEKDLSGVPINTLQLHPNGRYLLIHAKDSVLRMMDLRL